jgi:hypothetical protein
VPERHLFRSAALKMLGIAPLFLRFRALSEADFAEDDNLCSVHLL